MGGGDYGEGREGSMCSESISHGRPGVGGGGDFWGGGGGPEASHRQVHIPLFEHPPRHLFLLGEVATTTTQVHTREQYEYT